MYELQEVNGRQVKIKNEEKQPNKVVPILFKKKLRKLNRREMKSKVIPFLVKVGYKIKKTSSNKKLLSFLQDYSGNRRITLRKFYYEYVCFGVKYDKTLKHEKKKVDFVKTKDFLKSYKWRKVRYKALKKNDGCCELCGRSKENGIILNVDHIKPRKKYPELALDVCNLQVLCNECNHGKGNLDETDWSSE